MIAHCRYRSSAATVIAAVAFLLGEATFDEAVDMVEQLLGIQANAVQRGPPY
jgi:Mg/Co/Ni transporter MgtE